MRHLRLLANFFALALNFLLISMPALAAPSSRSKVAMSMFGAATLPDGRCIALGGSLFDPDFFRDLKLRKASGSVVFRRGSETVEFFPSQMHLRLAVIGAPCLDHKTRSRAETDLDAEYLSNLHFAAYWKTGLDLRPVESISLLTLSAQKRKSFLFLLDPTQPEYYTAWVFEFTISTGGVPVTDHLILTIETPEKERVARLSARLGD
jgi:hypothetical protein